MCVNINYDIINLRKGEYIEQKNNNNLLVIFVIILIILIVIIGGYFIYRDINQTEEKSDVTTNVNQ